MLIGPVGALETRTVFSVYDLRDAIKKQQAKTKPAGMAADVQSAIVKGVEAKVTPVGVGWGALGRVRRSAVVAYHGGLLLVYTTSDAQRQVSVGRCRR